jgi:hypothetical protein
VASPPPAPAARVGDSSLERQVLAGSELDPESRRLRDEAVALLDAGRPVEAFNMLRRVLDRHPTNMVAQVLLATADATARASREDVARSLFNRAPIRVARPPFEHRVTRSVTVDASAPVPRLFRIAEERSSITDDTAWFAAVGERLPVLAVPRPRGFVPVETIGEVPSFVPVQIGPLILVDAIQDGPNILAAWGPDYSGGRLLAVFDPSGMPIHFLDFGEFVQPPQVVPGDERFVDERLAWATLADGVLYVSHGHRTYARSSRGQNAYITAIDPGDGTILWRSPPLVAGAQNFLLVGRVIVTGYGFTAEPDYLYLLDRRDGSISSRVQVHGAPEYLLLHEGRIHVRTYDRNYVFELR